MENPDSRQVRLTVTYRSTPPAACAVFRCGLMRLSTDYDYLCFMLEAIDLTKRYEDGHLALDALNLRIETERSFSLGAELGWQRVRPLNLFLDFIRPTSSGRPW